MDLRVTDFLPGLFGIASVSEEVGPAGFIFEPERPEVSVPLSLRNTRLNVTYARGLAVWDCARHECMIHGAPGWADTSFPKVPSGSPC